MKKILFAIAMCLGTSPALAISVVDYRNSIVEVVVPKPDDTNVKYDGVVPVNEIPFKQRNDKFLSIGTAWFIDNKTLVSAAHVLPMDLYRQSKSFSIRTIDGKVFELEAVKAYDNALDLIAFALKSYPAMFLPLKTQTQAPTGTKVCAPGNALGEGIALRCGGEIASYNPEASDGKWQEIYFSTPVSPGNSGGPLLNEKNEVVGVVVRKINGESLNIATPISELAGVMKSSRYSVRGTQFASAQISALRVVANLAEKLPAAETIEMFYRQLMMISNKIDDRVQRELLRKSKQFGYMGKASNLASLRELSSLKYPAWVASSRLNQGSFGFNECIEESIKTKGGARLKSYRCNEDERILGLPYARVNDLKDSKRIMDSYLAIASLKRPVGPSKIGIQSLGSANESFEISDDLGRHWSLFRYKMGFIYDEITLACTANVAEILCLPMNMSPSSSLSNQGRLAIVNLNNFYMPYRGLVKEWKRYIKMESLPDFMDDAAVSSDGVYMSGMDFSMPTYSDTEISIDFRLNVKSLDLEMQSVTSSNSKSGYSRSIQIYHAPRKDSSDEYKKLYAFIKNLDASQLTHFVDAKVPTMVHRIAEDRSTLVFGLALGPELQELPKLLQGMSVDFPAGE